MGNYGFTTLCVIEIPWQPIALTWAFNITAVGYGSFAMDCRGNDSTCHGKVIAMAWSAMVIPRAVTTMPRQLLAKTCIRHSNSLPVFGVPCHCHRNTMVMPWTVPWHVQTGTGLFRVANAIEQDDDKFVSYFMACHQHTCRDTRFHDMSMPLNSHGIAARHHDSSVETVECHGSDMVCHDIAWRTAMCLGNAMTRRR